MPDYLTQLAQEYDALAESYCAVLCIVEEGPRPNSLESFRRNENCASARKQAIAYTTLASQLWGTIYQLTHPQS